MAGTRHTRKKTRKESCVGKIRFPTHDAAVRARWRRIREGAAEWTCTVYVCRFCGCRHIGHTPAEKHRRTARR